MDTLLKALVIIPTCSLILLPGYYLGAKLLKVKRFSLGATYLLLLITGAVLQVFAFGIPEFHLSGWTGVIVNSLPYVFITACIFGYLVQGEDGGSIGFGKGLALSTAL